MKPLPCVVRDGESWDGDHGMGETLGQAPVPPLGARSSRAPLCPPSTQGGGWAEAGLTVDSELEVPGLLARWAEGHTLVPPFVPQVTGGDAEKLATLPQRDARVSGTDRPGRTWGQQCPSGRGAGDQGGAPRGPHSGVLLSCSEERGADSSAKVLRRQVPSAP